MRRAIEAAVASFKPCLLAKERCLGVSEGAVLSLALEEEFEALENWDGFRTAAAGFRRREAGKGVGQLGAV